ncbi:cytochrome c biogenesis protein CcdA [Chloroflexi bacterium TSY]|nr:cytochrome c biogenesis protein CcdA [Chloroflexi bacterium TSY]
MASTIGNIQSAESQTTVVGTASALPKDTVSRMTILLHSLAFVIGFSVVFTLLGSAAGLLGRSLFQYQIVLQKVGAILLVLFGLTTIGTFRWLGTILTQRIDLKTNPAAATLIRFFDFLNTLLYTEKRVTDMHKVNRSWGYASSFAIGVSFSAGWVPCIGPILASILFMASDSATAVQGAILLAIYSLGLGIPFLLTGAAFVSVTAFLRKMNRHMRVVSIISGLFMLLISYYLWTDQLVTLTTQFGYLNELVFGMEEWVSSSLGLTDLSPERTSILGAAPLALIVGIISFVSPCVLPLVPAYIGYLSGTSLSNG